MTGNNAQTVDALAGVRLRSEKNSAGGSFLGQDQSLGARRLVMAEAVATDRAAILHICSHCGRCSKQLPFRTAMCSLAYNRVGETGMAIDAESPASRMCWTTWVTTCCSSKGVQIYKTALFIIVISEQTGIALLVAYNQIIDPDICRFQCPVDRIEKYDHLINSSIRCIHKFPSDAQQ